MLNLKKRVCKFGGHISGRTEYHGEDPVGACDLALSDLLLNEEEIDTLLGDGTWNRLFKKTRNSGMDGFPEPAEFCSNSKMPMQLEQKFEDSKVTLYGAAGDKTELVKCTLAKVKYEPQSGGHVLVSLQVQCNATPEQVSTLYVFMDQNIEAGVRFGRLAEGKDENQIDAPLTGGGAKHDDEPADDRPTAH